MKILFIDTCHPFLIESLRSDGHECIEGYEFSLDKILLEIKTCHGVVIRSRILLDEKILSVADNLKFIARAGAGMESIDQDYATRKNIACINSPEGNRAAVGEFAVGMLLSLMNNICRADAQVRNGKWIREGNRGYELNGKTVGIIGFGNTGSAFAAMLSGFDCKILAYDKYKTGFGNSSVHESTLQELFNEADILSIHVPLTLETEYFIDDNFINQFRKVIFFINTSRGKCVKTDDLVKNISNGKIRGACLDVVEYEDISFENLSGKNRFENNPSWKFLTQSDRVILTPHIAGWTYESLEKIARVLYRKITGVIASVN